MLSTRPQVTAAMLTPYGANGHIDYDGFSSLHAYLREAGIRSFLVHGTTGEKSDNFVECRGLIDEMGKLRSDDETWFVGTGDPHPDFACRLTEMAYKKGAAAGVVVTPDYFGEDQMQIGNYFDEVFSGGYPVIMYQSPLKGARPLIGRWIAGMAGKHEGMLVGLKTGDIALLKELKQNVGDGFYLACGDDRLIAAAAREGFGSASGTANCFPGVVKAIHDLASQAPGKADAIQRALTGFIDETVNSRLYSHAPAAWLKGVQRFLNDSSRLGFDAGDVKYVQPLSTDAETYLSHVVGKLLDELTGIGCETGF
jgi:4-hydroxy-tetrahydrodipicolinate synthase